MTTALFFRPGGLSTQHSGVDADVVLPSLLASDDYGEKTQRFSLPPQQTSPFLGEEANGPDKGSHWKPLGDDVMQALAKKSAARVATDEAFTEIREQLEEQATTGGTVQLAEILKRREESEAEQEEAGDDQDEDAEDEPTPQLTEALRVLTDLVALGRPSATSGAVARKEAQPES